MSKYSMNIIDMYNPSEAVKLAAVKQDGWAIRYIRKPSEAVKLAVIESLKDNYRTITVFSKDEISIGCKTKSLADWEVLTEKDVELADWLMRDVTLKAIKEVLQ